LQLQGGWNEPFVTRRSAGISENLADHGARDSVGLGDVGKRDPAVTIAQDRRPIDIERPSTDVSAFELGAPHAGAHPLDDQIGSAFTTMSSTM
jgi:hypothetical protein